MSLILRHEPERFGLTLDNNGFVPLEKLLAAVQSQKRWQSICEAQIRQVVRESDKQRYEIVDEASGAKIRARYGHSVEGAVSYEPVTPPDTLFHGTSR
ncbi:MAG: putative 2-phosphotransferase, partial [Abditibacteriota bacterium]|nr:putative 2-phosphotransferase [Abditibacteriota bacterium]